MDIENTSKAGSLYKNIFELSPDSIVTLDTKGFITSINSAGVKMLGYSINELTGRHFAKIGYMNIKDIPKYVEMFTAAISGKDVKPLEINLTRKDGTPVVVEVRVGLLKENGKITGIQAITRDVTERKKAEEALRESEEIFRSLMEHSPVYVFFKDENIRSLKLSRNYETMLGRPIAELLGKNMDDLFPSELAKSMVADDMRILKEGKEINVEEELNGRFYSTIKFPIKIEGKPRYLAGFTIDITERKEAEAKLKDSEERLKIIFESAPDAYYMNDLAGTFLDGNKAAEKVTGYKKDELIGKSFLKLKLLTLAQIPKAAALLAKNMIGLSTGPDEFNLNKKDGTQVAIEISTHPVKIKGQTMVLGIARDLSERKKAEKALKESEEKFKAFFDKANDGFILATVKDKNFILGNKAICEMIGYTQEEIKNLSIMDIHPEKDLPYVIDQFERQARNEIITAENIPVKRKDGSVFYAEISSSPVILHGDPCLMGVFRNVTERKMAEEKIKESEARYRLIFNSSTDLLAHMDRTGTILDVNKQVLEIGGYEKDEITGKKIGALTEIFPPQSIEVMLDNFTRDMLGEYHKPYEIEAKNKAGTRLFFEVGAVPLRSSTGEIVSILAIMHDITERKAAEAVREELLHKVEEANRKKTEYVSDVSHELRTPLASIKGFVSTIRSDPAMDEPTRQDFLRITEEETDRLTRIIEDLLDISRIESGRLKLSMRSFNIMDLIMKNIENIKPLAESKGIVIQSHPAPAPYIVYADQDKTSQIMINLLSNAIKYNKTGGKVSIDATEDDGKIRVNVEDTGIGISEKDIPHMFEKFFRAEGSSRETPGTGLGLAVTKSLVQVMGGMIEMKSKLGEGSRFSFSLPKYAEDKKEKMNEFS